MSGYDFEAVLAHAERATASEVERCRMAHTALVNILRGQQPTVESAGELANVLLRAVMRTNRAAR